MVLTTHYLLLRSPLHPPAHWLLFLSTLLMIMWYLKELKCSHYSWRDPVDSWLLTSVMLILPLWTLMVRNCSLYKLHVLLQTKCSDVVLTMFYCWWDVLLGIVLRFQKVILGISHHDFVIIVHPVLQAVAWLWRSTMWRLLTSHCEQCRRML